MRQASPEIRALVAPVVEGLGYEFIGAGFGPAENGQTLRVYIDHANGVGLEDCVAVNRQLGALLDVEDVIPGAYQLEVSSPGIDRPLFTSAQFARQQGQEVRVRMLSLVEGRRNFRGTLQSVDDDSVTVEVDGTAYVLALADVEQAHLIGDLQKQQRGS